MRYSNTTINKSGKTLLYSKSEREVAEAEKIVEAWRCQHDYVLDELEKNIIPLLSRNGIEILCRGRRLKRMTAIKNKMDRGGVWKLSEMQDVGGMRIVLPSLDELKQVKTLLSNNKFSEFSIGENNIVDYVESPKDSGYRSIHFVYKYTPEIEKHDCYGQKVEVQLRTRMQHIWAMAVEIAELITKEALKNGKGDKNWLIFFKNVGDLFAEAEINNGKLVNIYRDTIFINPKCIEELRSIMSSVSLYETDNLDDGYYLLNIDYTNRLSQIWTFPKEKQEMAEAKLITIEHENEGLPKDVVLVSVPEIKNLKEMYPSYYFDASDFIGTIQGFVDIKTGQIKSSD